MWKYFIFRKFLRKLREIYQKKILFPLLLPGWWNMEFHFSNSLSDVKLCEYYRKKWPKIKTFVFFTNFKNWIIWRMKHSKREIQSKVTSRPSIVRIHGYIIRKLIFSTFHRRTLREVKVETLSQTWKYFLFRKFLRKLRKIYQ